MTSLTFFYKNAKHVALTQLSVVLITSITGYYIVLFDLTLRYDDFFNTVLALILTIIICISAYKLVSNFAQVASIDKELKQFYISALILFSGILSLSVFFCAAFHLDFFSLSNSLNEKLFKLSIGLLVFSIICFFVFARIPSQGNSNALLTNTKTV